MFARAGAIVPMQELPEQMNDLSNPEKMEIYVFPGADNCFTLWEDEEIPWRMQMKTGSARN